MSSGESSHTKDGEVYWQSFSSLLSGRIEGSQTRVLYYLYNRIQLIILNKSICAPKAFIVKYVDCPQCVTQYLINSSNHPNQIVRAECRRSNDLVAVIIHNKKEVYFPWLYFIC